MSRADLNVVGSIASWFELAKPEDTRGPRDVQVQAGVHFEEAKEMLDEIDGLDGETRVLIDNARLALGNLAAHFKQSGDVVHKVSFENDINYLDALCDQIVTAVGVAHFMGYDIFGAINEVDRSNWSKFIENPETGKLECVKDANGKIAKGPNYFKADLSKYV